MVTGRRGELWTAAGGGRITSKPRPVLIIQSDLFAGSDYVTVAPITTTDVDSPTRVPLPATQATGVVDPSYVMTDKLHTIPRTNLGKQIGVAPTSAMVGVERAILVFLGMAD